MSKTYFINNVDSYLGRNILEKIRGPDVDDQQPENNLIATKLDPEDFDKPRGVKKVLKRAKPLLFKKYLTEQDVLIYDTIYGDPEDVLFALEAYRKAKELTGEKILILVSSLATWTMNGKKVRKEKQPEDPADDGNADGTNADPVPADDPPVPAPAAVSDPKPMMKGFDDDDDGKKNDEPVPAGAVDVSSESTAARRASGRADRRSRRGSPRASLAALDRQRLRRATAGREVQVADQRYQRLKEIEDEVLSFQLENVKTFVVCAGLLYGAGEDALEKFFQSAWLQKPAALPVPGSGDNLVPAIHVKDLTSFVLRIADAPPEQKYHFAFDGSRDRSLKKIIGDISAAAGSGETQSVDSTELVKEQFQPLMHIDFWALPSDMLIAVPFQWTPEEIEKIGQPKPEPVQPADVDPAADPQPDEPVPEPQDPDFEWTSKAGIGENGKLILAEFCKVHSTLDSDRPATPQHLRPRRRRLQERRLLHRALQPLLHPRHHAARRLRTHRESLH